MVPVEFVDTHEDPHTRRLLLCDHVLPVDADWTRVPGAQAGSAGGSVSFLSIPVSFAALQVSGGSPVTAGRGDSSVFVATSRPHTSSSHL